MRRFALGKVRSALEQMKGPAGGCFLASGLKAIFDVFSYFCSQLEGYEKEWNFLGRG